MTAAVVFVVIGVTAAYAIVRRRARRAVRLEAGQAGRAVIAANLAASRRR